MTAIRGLLFDKDGTLYDFHATWSAFTRGLIEDLAHGDPAIRAELAARAGYDWQSGRFTPESVIIAHTTGEVAEALLPALPGTALDDLVDRMNERASALQTVEAVPLRPLMAALGARGLRLGLVTNDAEMPARAHLAGSGVSGDFAFICGFDSGHGAKPDPAPLLAFARQEGLAPATVAMIGDSRHDLQAGRAAGMRTVAVLTGIADAAELGPLADVVLPDIGYLPAWLDSLG